MARVVARVVYNHFPEILVRLPREARAIAMETAYGLEAFVKTGMAESKNGRWYGNHRASAPGEMPAVDLGALVNSIATEPTENGAAVYSDKEYAVHLEFGAPMANLEPRPFFAPAAQEMEPRFIEAMRNLESRL